MRLLRRMTLLILQVLFLLPSIAHAFGDARDLMQSGTYFTTSSCSNIRTSSSFQARLDLLYLYEIEYSVEEDIFQEDEPDLAGMDRAVATALAQALDHCDDQNRPATAIQISATQAHKLSSRVCEAATSLSICQVVEGKTSVLLDSGTSEISPIAYAVIDLVLSDVDRLNQFTSTQLLRAKFLGQTSETVVVFDNTASGGSSGGGDDAAIYIAIVAALFAFLATSCCIFCVWRKWRIVSKVCSNLFQWSPRKNFDLTCFHSKRRQYWKQLADDNVRYMVNEEDGSPLHHWMMAMASNAAANAAVANMPMEQVQTSQLAVSDLTSDSESIKSSLRMDSIKEEVEDDELVLAELAMADMTAINNNNASSSSFRPNTTNSSSIYPNTTLSSSNPNTTNSSSQPGDNTGTSPDDSEELVEFPAFTEHYQKELVAEVLSEAASCLSATGSNVWEKAGMPSSYYDNSDPDADTPIRSNMDQVQKIEMFDALAMGDSSYLADVSVSSGEEEDGEMILSEKLLLPTLDHRHDKTLSSSIEPRESIDLIPSDHDENDDSHVCDGGDLSHLEQRFHQLFGGAAETSLESNMAGSSVGYDNRSLREDGISVVTNDDEESVPPSRHQSNHPDTINANKELKVSELEKGSVSPRSSKHPDDSGLAATDLELHSVSNDDQESKHPSKPQPDKPSSGNNLDIVSSVTKDVDCTTPGLQNQTSPTTLAEDGLCVATNDNKESTATSTTNDAASTTPEQPHKDQVSPTTQSEEGLSTGTQSPSFANHADDGVTDQADGSASQHNQAAPVKEGLSIVTNPGEHISPESCDGGEQPDLNGSTIEHQEGSSDAVGVYGSSGVEATAIISPDSSETLPKECETVEDQEMHQQSDCDHSELHFFTPEASLKCSAGSSCVKQEGTQTPDILQYSTPLGDMEPEQQNTSSANPLHPFAGDLAETETPKVSHLTSQRPPEFFSPDAEEEAESLQISALASSIPVGRFQELVTPRDGDIRDGPADDLTSPEGLQFLEESSDDSKSLSQSHSMTSLKDLRLLGPVIADSTSEDVSVLARTVTEDNTSSEDLSFSKEDEEEDSSSSESLALTLPYTVKQQKAHLSLNSSVLSDITNGNDADTSYGTAVSLEKGGPEVSV